MCASITGPSSSPTPSQLVPVQPHQHRVFLDGSSSSQNGCIESFNGRLRDGFLNGQPFDRSLRGSILPEDRRIN